MTATVNRIIVSVRDIDASLTFYRDLLGLSAAVQGGFATLDAGNGVALFLHQRETRPSDLAVAASLTVGGLDALVTGWAERGGAVVDAPADQAWGERMAVVRDPDGHLVCLVERA